jgi:YHS domain-containing protein
MDTSTSCGIVAVLMLALACNTRPADEQVLPLPARSVSPEQALQPRQAASAASAIQRVDPSQVCMVNNQYMGRPQIPVSVNGKTYYGCCPMCKGKLEREVSARAATDPVTGRQVDKADALIGKVENGDVLYFESQASLAAYRAN